jgi:kinesin family protein 6/9
VPAGPLQGEGGEEDEELDAGEAFERMQLARVAANDPDSAAYHAARKKAAPLATVRASGAFGGVKGAADAVRKKEYEALINAGLAR